MQGNRSAGLTDTQQEHIVQQGVVKRGADLVETLKHHFVHRRKFDARSKEIHPKESVDMLKGMADDISRKSKRVDMNKEEKDSFIRRLVIEELGIFSKQRNSITAAKSTSSR